MGDGVAFLLYPPPAGVRPLYASGDYDGDLVDDIAIFIMGDVVYLLTLAAPRWGQTPRRL